MLNQINCAVYYGGGTSISADTPIFEPEFEYQEKSIAGAVWLWEHSLAAPGRLDMCV